MSEKKIKITQIKSTIGSVPKHQKTMEALGLRKIRQSVIKKDSPVVRGMIWQVKHMVKVEDYQ